MLRNKNVFVSIQYDRQGRGMACHDTELAGKSQEKARFSFQIIQIEALIMVTAKVILVWMDTVRTQLISMT